MVVVAADDASARSPAQARSSATSRHARRAHACSLSRSLSVYPQDLPPTHPHTHTHACAVHAGDGDGARGGGRGAHHCHRRPVGRLHMQGAWRAAALPGREGLHLPRRDGGGQRSRLAGWLYGAWPTWRAAGSVCWVGPHVALLGRSRQHAPRCLCCLWPQEATTLAHRCIARSKDRGMSRYGGCRVAASVLTKVRCRPHATRSWQLHLLPATSSSQLQRDISP